ncbi:TonB-dependent receptor [Rufibacter tibetensis]|uniref:TonB-dependent receptor n=1 Tax=Rufibacter tibetensis TaxID=512763 RepID=A0A0P0CCT5_9BACT|nr:TonB-dependent receptor [Rufibacter tibetensis]ALJ01515.1 TonB-dependent receptor [Rufibacter tibetensis]
MAHYYRIAFLLLILLCFGKTQGKAQTVNEPLLTLTLQDASFEDFVREVESKTKYRFYYEPAAVDSFKVTIQVTQKPLKSILDQVVEGTNLKYAMTEQGYVLITQGKEFMATLPEGFFNREQKSSGNQTLVMKSTDATPYIAGEQNKKKATSEAKLYLIGTKRDNANGNANLAGHLRDAKSGEPIIGATVYIQSPLLATTSDQYGYFSLTLPVGERELLIRGIGIKNSRRRIGLYADGKLDIEIEEDVRSLKEVLVEAEKDRNVAGMQMGMERLDIRTIKQVPTAFGETDILRVVLTLPGVKSVGEGSTGMNVRGGSTDQNLILFNDATIYNPSHLFGFFSAFNPDIIKSVELHKSNVPARYGGRLSSVLEITTRDGNKKKLAGSGGIGLLTSRLTLEGPIIKDKTSFMVAGRSTYSNWLLKKLPQESFKKSSASFYDLNAQINHEFDSKNTLYLSSYLSKDKFRLGSDSLYNFSNQNASVKWKHIFHNQLYSVVTGAYSRYGYGVNSENNPVNAADLAFSMNQANLQADFNYFLNSKHTVDFGASSILYNVSPGSLTPVGSESLVMRDVLQKEKALESALYVSDQIDISPRFSVYLGLRYSMFNALGPREAYTYAPNVPKNESTILDTVSYSSGKAIATYHGPEYRVSARLGLTDHTSIKASFNRMRQYIHMLSNTATMSPTDTWKLSDANIRPQVGDQFALGYYQNFRANTVELSVEGYYKKMKDFLDYRNGADIILNHHIETDVANAEGKAYGVEMMLKKMTGKLNGWVSYTYSRTLVRLNNPQVSEIINQGKWYPSNFDKPHDFTMISNYRFSQRFSTSLNFTYSTGRPITLPIAKYYDGNTQRIFYSDRNQYRVPNYYRVDFAMNIEGNHKVKKLAHSSWTLAVYNVTGRKNPYSVYFRSENRQIKGYKLSIFGQPIPTVTYNFKF